MGFPKKSLILSKIAKGSKFAVECDWNRKISQNIQNFGFFVKEMGFLEKVLIFFQNR